MRVFLLANQPERTTRLKMFKGSLENLGYEIVVPKFDTRSWLGIARQAKAAIKREKPDVVHLFNVPDVIYHNLPNLKGSYYKKLIYDYRSPWGVELGMSFGPAARIVGERFEHELAAGADIITTVNKPLGDKVGSYRNVGDKPIFIIPNYPNRDFSQINDKAAQGMEDLEEGAIIFVGRISKQEGIGSLLKLIRDLPEERFWIIGDGPFAKWYLRKNATKRKVFRLAAA